MKITRPIEIDPITRLLYWSKDLQKEWDPRIARIKKAYNQTELETVLRGDRRIYVYHIYSNLFDQSYEFLRENDMEFYPTNKSAIYEGFSHKHRALKEGENWILYGGACKRNDQEAGELFAKASTQKGPTNHTAIGELLGYPSCCVDFFNKNWPTTSIDPIFEAAMETKGAAIIDLINGNKVIAECHPYCNNMLRYFGIRITPHLTHSFQCPDSIKMGNRWIEIMREIDSKAADWAIELASMPLNWNCYKGVAIIDNDIFKGVTNSDHTLKYKIVENNGWTSKL